jgi:hypothetical protein
VLLAHREEEVIVGDGYDKPVLERVELNSGLTFGDWDGTRLTAIQIPASGRRAQFVSSQALR